MEYNVDNYNKSDFNNQGIHRETGTKYDLQGYDIDGYNERGFNRNGLSRNKSKYDLEGYDKDGYNKRGFNREGFHRETGTHYDPQGYGADGYNERGFNRRGLSRNKSKYDSEGYDKDGYNKRGFNREGIHRETGTLYDLNGYDQLNLNEEGYTFWGYDKNRYDKHGFSIDGFHKVTGTKYNPDGYDLNGYDFQGYDKDGYNKYGYDKEGFNKEGFNKKGFYKETGTEYDLEGYNSKKFNSSGIHKETGTKYDPNGYDIKGYDKEGYNKRGIDKDGYDKNFLQSQNTNREEIEEYLYLHALRVINSFINSDYPTLKEFYHFEQITEERFKILLSVVEKKDKNLYDHFMDIKETRMRKHFINTMYGVKEIMSQIKNGIKMDNGKIRNFEYFDLLLNSKFDINSLVKLVNSNNDIKPSKEYHIFVKKVLNRNKKQIDINYECKTKNVLLLGEEERIITDEEKIMVYEFMKKRNLPLEQGLFSMILRNYIKKYLDDEIINQINNSTENSIMVVEEKLIDNEKSK